MAVLTNQQLADMRKRYRQKFGQSGEIDFDKATVNAAFQVIEDWYTNDKASVKADIDTATSPYTFTNAQAKHIFYAWLLNQAAVEGA